MSRTIGIITWEQVGRVLVNRWPSGPDNQGWEPEQAETIVSAMRQTTLSPRLAILGLRAAESNRIPTADEVRDMAWPAMARAGAL